MMLTDPLDLSLKAYLNEFLTSDKRGWFTTIGSKDQVLQHLINFKNLMKGGENNATNS